MTDSYRKIIMDEERLENANDMLESYRGDLIKILVGAEEQGDKATMDLIQNQLKEVHQDFRKLLDKEVQQKILTEYPAKRKALF